MSRDKKKPKFKVVDGGKSKAKTVIPDDLDLEKEQIVIRPDDVRGMVDDAERALAREAPDDPAKRVYARGNRLTRVVDRSSGKIFAEVPEAALPEILSANALWMKPTKKGSVPDYPPAQVIKALRARATFRELDNATLLTQAPMLLPDGSVIDKPGFYKESGILYLPDAEYPPLSGLTDEDSARDIETIEDALGEFPFESQAHRAAAYAAILTCAGRNLIDGPCPLFAFNAPEKGSGKDLLARVCGVIGTGHEPFSSQFVEDDESEMRKRITSIAIAGTRVVLLGNVSGTLGGPALCDALTLTHYSDRVLGLNEWWSGEFQSVFFASGNNMRIGDDMDRRICPIRIDRAHPEPWKMKGFKHEDLLAYVKEQRPKLVVAGLSMFRRYIVAGRPDMNPSTWGSFPKWAPLVIGTLKFAKLADPGEARESFALRADETATRERQFVKSWECLVKAAGKPLRASEALARLKSKEDVINGRFSQIDHALFIDTLSWLTDTEGADWPSSKKLGKLLAKLEGRVLYENARIARAGTNRDDVGLWGIERVEPTTT